MSSERALWERYRNYLMTHPSIGLRLDVSRMDFDEKWVEAQVDLVRRAFDEMVAVERGEIVNTDEKRRVGHYWLRDAARAPEPAMQREITQTLDEVKRFARDVHEGRLKGRRGTFTDLLVIGIGGSSLGPRFVASALGHAGDRLRPRFIDNTDPDGIDQIFGELGGSAEQLGRTLTVVISKSGGTKETRNGMREAAARYLRAGLEFSRHAVAVTGDGSELHEQAHDEHWLATFPMWDWVGGRTSETSAVGLLPAALQGLDIDALLDGARACDAVTRDMDPAHPMHNPSMALALAWLHETRGRGEKDMVILPYKDRLALFSQYLQQLVMESLGKERDREGRVVHQGISVYGNKGSTDQHAYVQQLREGVPNFFATFISVLKDSDVTPPAPPSIEVEPGVTTGDYLQGFLLGTRRALYDNGRHSITLTIDDLSPRSVGVLIALYERAVGFYAGLVGINAYHQPGVEAGKKAAQAVIALQLRVMKALRDVAGKPCTVEELAAAAGGAGDEIETVFHVLEHLAANPDRGVRRLPGKGVFDAKYVSI